jgi:hypothetical protein
MALRAHREDVDQSSGFKVWHLLAPSKLDEDAPALNPEASLSETQNFV